MIYHNIGFKQLILFQFRQFILNQLIINVLCMFSFNFNDKLTKIWLNLKKDIKIYFLDLAYLLTIFYIIFNIKYAQFMLKFV